MSGVRKLALETASRPSTSTHAQRAQVFAILDLADAIREHGKMVAEALQDIDVTLVALVETVQQMD